MTTQDSSSEDEIPPILQKLWSNWKKENGGAGRCNGCPAHWSIREDISGEPGKRQSSFQHRPFCGDGSLDPDILIIAREPGPPREDDLDDNRREYSLGDVRNKSITSSPGGTVEYALPLFEQIEQSEFDGGFTQIRKCNKLRSGSNSTARSQCAGTTDDYQGYLYEEVKSLAPDFVVTITGKGQNEFCEVFDLPRVGTNEMATGSLASGLRVIRQDSLGFTWFPAPHPDPRGASQVYKRLDKQVNTREYFELLAKDILHYMRTNNSSK